MSVGTISAHENRLIAGLPQAEQRSLTTQCEEVELSFGERLLERGEQCRHVYFPTRSFISSLAGVENDAQIEVGLIGDEGMMGACLLLGTAISPVRAVVQGAGAALRIRADLFVAELEHSRALRLSVGRYLFVLTDQLTQTAVCVRYHLAEARLARWLLMTRDRAHSDAFRITHEFMAYMLAVRRASVTEIAHALAAKGVIEYRRGEVRILDGAKLEAASCECYQQSLASYARVLRSNRPSVVPRKRRAGNANTH